MNGYRNAQQLFDRRLPVDLRTDAEIERDAAERRHSKQQLAYVFDPVRWEKVTAARLQTTAETSSDGEQKTAGR